LATPIEGERQVEKLRWKLREPRPAGTLVVGNLKLEVDDNGCFETEGRPDFPLYAIARRYPCRIDAPDCHPEGLWEIQDPEPGKFFLGCSICRKRMSAD
jgi:hypothetical protein